MKKTPQHPVIDLSARQQTVEDDHEPLSLPPYTTNRKLRKARWILARIEDKQNI